MLKPYIRTAIRNLLKNKAFSLINIFGLGLGLACSILIFLWINNERSIDQFHANGKQLFNVYERVYTGSEVNAWYETPGILADELKRMLPGVQYSSSFFEPMERVFKANNKMLKQTGSFAGADFFKMFSYKLIAGNASSALSTPKDISISRHMAEAFFGEPQEAIGKTIRLENRKDFRVTAVFETLPQNSSVKFDYIINWQAAVEDNANITDWGNHGFQTLIMLKDGTNAQAFENQITHFLNKYSKFNKDYHVELGVQPFADKYLNATFKNGKPSGGRIEYIRLFGIIAILILLIACINFMNLTTARSAKRAKEIGVRKVIGAGRASLLGQFMGEAILLTCFATLVGLLLVALLLPAFNGIIQKQILFPTASISFWLGIIALTLGTALLAGSYPALFLSSLKPVNVLKGAKANGGTLLRKGLVVFQFVLSIIFIVGTLVVSRQINYIQTKNLGYNRTNLLCIPKEGELKNKFNVFKQEALKIPGIQSISFTRSEPSDIQSSTSDVEWDGKDISQMNMFGYAGVGEDFAKTLGIQVLEGRDFSANYPNDTTGFILNEEAAKLIGYKSPVGKLLTFWDKKAPIIGVYKNFHFNSLHEPIKPMIIWFGEKKKFTGNILIRIEAGQTQHAIQQLEVLCKKLNADFPFTYKFADESYNKLYKSEQLTGKLTTYFAALAIFISCLGLLGLAMFTTEQRIREIGIRKVLGASVASILQLLSRDFVKLVFIAFLIASPVAYWVLQNWLQGFAYRIELNGWMFGLAGVLALVIALLTVGLQAVKAAMANPVKSLRAE